MGSDSTSVTINLGQREISAGSLSLQQIPLSVKSVVLKITGPGMGTIKRTINVANLTDVVEIVVVPSGVNRLFEVMAYDDLNGNTFLLFEGDTTAALSGTPVSITVIMQATDYDNDLSQGFDSLTAREILHARDHFRRAVNLSEGSTSNQADTARFFYAITRVAALLHDVVSDGNPNNGFNKLSDLLDAFDCVAPDTFLTKVEVVGDLIGNDDGICEAGEDCTIMTDLLCGDEVIGDLIGDDDGICEPNEACTEILPGNSPTGSELQDFMVNVVAPELGGAIGNFNNISQTFNVLWDEPVSGTNVESDYGDVFALRAGVKGMLSLLLAMDAFNLDVDIDAEENDLDNPAEEFFADNPNFLTLADATQLFAAKAYLTGSALDDTVDAIDWILAEADPQNNDFINIDIGINPGQVTQQEIDQARADIATVRTCLDGPCTLDDNMTPGDTSDDTVIDLSAFYDGFDIRDMLPAFVGDYATGTLPDPTLDGILIQDMGDAPTVLNEDLNSNGRADIFEGDLYYVYGGDTVPPDPYSWDFRGDPVAAGYVFLGAANSSDGISNFAGAYNYYLIQNFRERGFWDEDYYVNLDAVEFLIGFQEYCCTGNYWSSSWNPPDFMGGPDGSAFFMRNFDFVLMESTASSPESITVYTLP